GERADAAAGGDEAVEALALLRVVDVGHERPEDRHGEQDEDADPDEEHPCHSLPLDVEGEQQPEDRQVGDEEVVDERDEAAARDAGDERAVERHRREHHEERRREKPLQVLHAARDAHLVSQRPQDVVAREQAEEIRERPQHGADLFGPHRDDSLKEVQGLRFSAWRISAAVRMRPETEEPRSNALEAASEPAFTGSKPASETSCMPSFSAAPSSAETGSAMRGAGRFASRAMVA